MVTLCLFYKRFSNFWPPGIFKYNTFHIHSLHVFDNRSIFIFRTNFYQISTCEELGYPPGIAEKIVADVFRFCDPYKQYHRQNIFLPATVAEEVEICTYEDQDIDAFSVEIIDDVENINSVPPDVINEASSINNPDNLTENINFESLKINESSQDSNKKIAEKPGTSKEESSPQSTRSTEETKVENSESFNGAVRDTYSWSQNICELGNFFVYFTNHQHSIGN